MDSFDKQPGDVLDYGVDLTKWLVTGDTVVDAVASVTPSSLSVEVTDEDTVIPKVWVSGGINNVVYQITLKVTTAVGRIKEFEFKIRVVER